MPRDNQSTRPGFIIIPGRKYICSWRITITNTDTSEVWDITNYVIDLNLSWQAGRVAEASLNIVNDYGRWLNTWNGGEVLDVYGEYVDDPNPTNKLYSGKLDSIFFSLGSNGYTCYIESRQTPELVDTKIVEQFDNALSTDAISQIVDGYYTGIITFPSIPVSTERFTGSFRYTSGISAIAEIAEKAGMDVYINTNNELQLFPIGSIVNEDEVVDYQTNLMSFPKFGKDRKKEFNRVTVFGKDNDNIVLLKTEEDLDSQADTWRKDNVLTESSITTMDEVQSKADIELANGVTLYDEGTVSCLGMTLIKPGDNLTILVPYCGADGYYNIRSISHTLSSSGFITNLNIKYSPETLNEMFKERITAEERLKPYNNLNNMTDSYTIYFNESTPVVTLISCEVYSDSDKYYLKLTDGETDGTCLTDIHYADKNILQCELRIKSNYPNQELCTFQVSNNGGVSYEDITPGTLHSFSSTGSQLRFIINMSGDSTHNPIFESVCVLYKV